MNTTTKKTKKNLIFFVIIQIFFLNIQMKFKYIKIKILKEHEE